MNGALFLNLTKWQISKKNINHLLNTSKIQVTQFLPDQERFPYHYKKVALTSTDVHDYEEKLIKIGKNHLENPTNKKLVQQMELIDYNNPNDVWKYQGGQFNVNINRADNMKPLSIELIFGEGKIPDRLQVKLDNNHWYSKPWVKRAFFLSLFFIVINIFRSRLTD